MIVISQKVVKAAGLDFPTAIGLMQPAEGELVVCIHNVHDGISSPVIAEEPQAPRLHADEYGGHSVRHTHRASVPVDYELPTIAPTQRPSVSTALPLPMTAEEIKAHRLAAWMMTDAQRLGIGRLPERGVTFHELDRVARALGAEATLLVGGAVRLQSKWGNGEYGTLASAAAALNARAFNPETGYG